MDLTQLSQIQEKRSKLNKSKNAHAELILKRAYQQLERYQTEQRPDKRKDLLVKSIDYFEKTLHIQRANPDSYMGLAAIYLILNAPNQALLFIQEGERLNPEHPDITVLKEAVQAETHSTQESPYQNTLEDRFKQIQSDLIQAHTFTLKSSFLSLEKRETQCKELAWAFKQVIRWRLEIRDLESHMNVLSLRHLLKAFEQNLDKAKIQFRVAGDMLALIQEMGQIKKRCISDLNQINCSNSPFDVDQYAAQLEALLDHCDHIADHLDHLEEQGYSIQAIEPHYNQLAQTVDLLQDSLDQY